MYDVTNAFLERYKALESAVRLHGGCDTVLDYESRAIDADKLRLCRTLRNFLQHHPNGSQFAQATQAMVDYIEQEIVALTVLSEKDKSGYKLTPLKFSATLRAAVKRLVGSGVLWLPVVDKTGAPAGVLTRNDALILACKPKGLDAVLEEASGRAFWNGTLSNISVVDCCLDLGIFVRERRDAIIVRKGKYSGVLQWQA